MVTRVGPAAAPRRCHRRPPLPPSSLGLNPHGHLDDNDGTRQHSDSHDGSGSSGGDHSCEEPRGHVTTSCW